MKKNHIYGSRDMWQYYRRVRKDKYQETGEAIYRKNITYKQYRDIINSLYEQVDSEIFDTKRPLTFPGKLGTFLVRRYKLPQHIIDSAIKYSKKYAMKVAMGLGTEFGHVFSWNKDQCRVDNAKYYVFELTKRTRLSFKSRMKRQPKKQV